MFADKKGIPILQNTCVNTVMKKVEEGGLFPQHYEINSLWECSGRVFQMQRLLVDLFATKCDLGRATTANTYHPKFLEELIRALYEMKIKQTLDMRLDFWAKRRSYYADNVDHPILLD